jgi:dTDP-4-amino-4,6-dideoxygalactose transaminase
MSELHALFGLELLPRMKSEIHRRIALLNRYRKIFEDTDIKLLDSPNGSYAPIVFSIESQLLLFQSKLAQRNIFTRRYFYPSLDTLDFLSDPKIRICSNSRNLASRILCLPIGKDVSKKTLKDIETVLRELLSND